jgi:arogenate dehydrogenase (NADP+)
MSCLSVLLVLSCRVLATSRTPYYQQAAEMGAEFYEDPDDFCEEHPDVVILATSILSTEPVLRSLPLTRLKRSTLVVDVLSVKVRNLDMSLDMKSVRWWF